MLFRSGKTIKRIDHELALLIGSTEEAGSIKLKLELTESNVEYEHRGAQNTN